MQSAALRQYYATRFPVEALVGLLTRGGALPLASRELAFQWNGGASFSRWRSFSTADELKEALLREVPERVELGAAYPGRAPTRDSPVLGRELVFDFDLPDYDDLRTCPCKGGPKTARCAACWRLLSSGAHGLEAVLRRDLGFERIVWVYSGSKGLHCWVLDESAFRLEEREREQLCSYLRGGARVLTATQLELSGDERRPPRLDAKVTTVMSHLIKAPSAVHPVTKNVSVPLRCPQELDDPPALRADGPLEPLASRVALLVHSFQSLNGIL